MAVPVTPRHSRLPAPLLILIAGVLWGTIGIFGKAADLGGMGWADVAFWRAAGTGALFLGHAAVTKARFPRGRDLLITMGFGVVAVAVLYASFQLAVLTGGAGLAAVLLYSAPAFVAVLAWLLLQEKLTWRELVGITGTVGGVALVSLSGGHSAAVGVAAIGWGILAGFTYSLYYLFGKVMFARYDAVALFGVALPVGALVLLPLASFAQVRPSAMGAVAGLAIVATYLPYLAYARGLTRLPATHAAVIASIEPVVAAALSAMLYGERLGGLGLTGAALVLAAAAWLSVAHAPARPRFWRRQSDTTRDVPDAVQTGRLDEH